MHNFNFWQRWLVALGIIITIFGLALAFLNQTPLFDLLFNNQINPVFWGTQLAPQEVLPFQAWIYGVLGATVAGWGVFLAFLSYYPFKQREKWAWNCLALGMLVWFLSDTTISLFYRVYFNAAFNLLLFSAAILPLAFSRKAFNS